jgi:N-acyl-D-amino-acid deacylase
LWSRERKRSPSQIAEVGFNNFGQIDSWADIRIAISPRGAAEPGRTIEEIARERRCDPLDAVCDVIIADKGATRIVVRSMSEADVRAIAADPLPPLYGAHPGSAAAQRPEGS